MTPSPPSNSSFADNFRFRSRRQRHVTPYDPAQNATPTQTNAQAQVTPLVDEQDGGDGDAEVAGDELSDAEVEDQEDEVEEDEVPDIDDETHDVEEEEGGIEEAVVTLYANMPPIEHIRPLDDIVAQLIRTPLPMGTLLHRHAAHHPNGIFSSTANPDGVTVPMDIDPTFDPAELGLKEIGNLASWTVSSCKPGCGVDELREEDTNLFWQSDGPQPHHLNIHFCRLVLIRAIRIYLDFEADESYTPTRITLLAGTGYHDLIPFSTLEFAQPKGWIDVSLDNVGGGEDGKTLRAFLVQVRVMENHQNGKDTHVRGLKIYARDERLGRGGLGVLDQIDKSQGKRKIVNQTPATNGGERTSLIEPDWMGDPEIR